jgi:hypothetical protein
VWEEMLDGYLRSLTPRTSPASSRDAH